MSEKDYIDICKTTVNIFVNNRDIFFGICNNVNDKHSCNLAYLTMIHEISKCSQEIKTGSGSGSGSKF